MSGRRRPRRRPRPSEERAWRSLSDLHDYKAECQSGVVATTATARPGALELMDDAIRRPGLAVGICSASTRGGFEKVVDAIVGQVGGPAGRAHRGRRRDAQARTPRSTTWRRRGSASARSRCGDGGATGSAALRAAKAAEMRVEPAKRGGERADADFYGEGADAAASWTSSARDNRGRMRTAARCARRALGARNETRKRARARRARAPRAARRAARRERARARPSASRRGRHEPRAAEEPPSMRVGRGAIGEREERASRCARASRGGRALAPTLARVAGPPPPRRARPCEARAPGRVARSAHVALRAARRPARASRGRRRPAAPRAVVERVDASGLRRRCRARRPPSWSPCGVASPVVAAAARRGGGRRAWRAAPRRRTSGALPRRRRRREGQDPRLGPGGRQRASAGTPTTACPPRRTRRRRPQRQRTRRRQRGGDRRRFAACADFGGGSTSRAPARRSSTRGAIIPRARSSSTRAAGGSFPTLR